MERTVAEGRAGDEAAGGGPEARGAGVEAGRAGRELVADAGQGATLAGHSQAAPVLQAPATLSSGRRRMGAYGKVDWVRVGQRAPPRLPSPQVRALCSKGSSLAQSKLVRVRPELGMH